MLKDPRHERYARYVSRGMTKIDAVEKAGWARHPSSYHRLEKSHPEIVERIIELKEEREASDGPTKTTIFGQFAEIYEKAVGRDDKLHVAHAVTRSQAEMMGFLGAGRKVEQPASDDFENMSDAELERIVAEADKAESRVRESAARSAKAGEDEPPSVH